MNGRPILPAPPPRFLSLRRSRDGSFHPCRLASDFRSAPLSFAGGSLRVIASNPIRSSWSSSFIQSTFKSFSLLIVNSVVFFVCASFRNVEGYTINGQVKIQGTVPI